MKLLISFVSASVFFKFVYKNIQKIKSDLLIVRADSF